GTAARAPAAPRGARPRASAPSTGCWRIAIAEAGMGAETSELRGAAALELWRRVLAAPVRHRGPDLTTRQLAVFLQVYLAPPPHTVRGLASALGLSKPVVTRALDSLSRLGYVRRRRDEADRRNVLVQRTVKGAVYLSDFAAG